MKGLAVLAFTSFDGASMAVSLPSDHEIADARLAARGYEQCANRCGQPVGYEGELCRECEAK